MPVHEDDWIETLDEGDEYDFVNDLATCLMSLSNCNQSRAILAGNEICIAPCLYAPSPKACECTW